MGKMLVGGAACLCLLALSEQGAAFDAPGAGAGSESPVAAAAKAGAGALAEQLLGASGVTGLLLSSGRIQGDAWGYDLATSTNQKAEIGQIDLARRDIVAALSSVGGALQAKQDGASSELAELLRLQTKDLLTGVAKTGAALASAVQALSHDPVSLESDCLPAGVAVAEAAALPQMRAKIKESEAFRRSYHADALYSSYPKAWGAAQQNLLLDPPMKDEPRFQSSWLFPPDGQTSKEDVARVHLMVSVLSNPHQAPSVSDGAAKTPSGMRAAAELKVKSAYAAVAEGLIDSVATGHRQPLEGYSVLVPELAGEASSDAGLPSGNGGYSREQYYMALQRYFAANVNLAAKVNASGMGDLLRLLVRLQIASFSLNVDMYRNLNNVVVGLGALVGQHTEDQNLRVASYIAPLREKR